jgi:hypothetical protein
MINNAENNWMRKVCILIISVALVYMISCDKEKFDFRDEFIGKYRCIEIYSYLDPLDTILHWSSDTISYNSEIEIIKDSENSIKVIIDSFSFVANHVGEKKFTCKECQGPPDYAQFMGYDSIYVYRRGGNACSYTYFGNKK